MCAGILTALLIVKESVSKLLDALTIDQKVTNPSYFQTLKAQLLKNIMEGGNTKGVIDQILDKNTKIRYIRKELVGDWAFKNVLEDYSEYLDSGRRKTLSVLPWLKTIGK